MERNVPSIRVRACHATHPGRVKHRLISLNVSGSDEIIRQLARPCQHSNTYIRPSPPATVSSRGGRGLFKLKSRQDLNFKISIWLANLSASFRPRERTRFRLLLDVARLRGSDIKSLLRRVLFFFPPFYSLALLLPSASPLLLTLSRKVAELKISSLNRDMCAPSTNILCRFHYIKKIGIQIVLISLLND